MDAGNERIGDHAFPGIPPKDHFPLLVEGGNYGQSGIHILFYQSPVPLGTCISLGTAFDHTSLEGSSRIFCGQVRKGSDLAIDQDVPYLGSIPLDAEVRIGGDNGRPIVVAAPNSEAGEAFREITQIVAARVSVLTLSIKQPDIIPLQMIG